MQSGEIVAGPDVRNAAARHLRDLIDGPARGLRFDHAKAARGLRFFPAALRLAGGKHEGVPFVPDRWEAFVIGSLFGWVHADTGLRRFRVAYIETAKGSGKSPLVGGIGLYMMIADGQPRAEIYAAAGKRDQAQILFRDVVAMVRQSEPLMARLRFSGGAGREWNISDPQTWSFFRTISSDGKQSGTRPYCGIVDELHEHDDANTVEMLEAGQKSLAQPLTLAITNSGHDKTSVCWAWRETATKVCAGVLHDDSFFGFVCGLDPDDRPLHDEACWAKANPSLQFCDLPGYDYLRRRVTRARNMPSAESAVLRLNFCVWTEAESLFVGRDTWMRGQQQYSLDDFRGERCWGGLDLSSVRDLTALVLVFKRDGLLWLWPIFWLPAEGLAQKSEADRFPYVAHHAAGWLETTPGGGIDKSFVARRIAELAGQFGIQSIAYDRHRIEDLRPFLEAEGCDVHLEPHGQGFVGMAPAIDALETALVNGQLMHPGNPLMTWCAANAVVVPDPAGNRKFNKQRATGRIDGMVAAAMGVRAATLDGDGDEITTGYVEW